MLLAVRRAAQLVAQRTNVGALLDDEDLEAANRLTQIFMFLVRVKGGVGHALDAFVRVHETFVCVDDTLIRAKNSFVGTDQAVRRVLDRVDHLAEAIVHRFAA